MKPSLTNAFLVRCAAALFVLLFAGQAAAVTEILNRNVEMNDGGDLPDNRPFFTAGGPDGYVGTATPGVDTTSTVTAANVGLGGNNTIGVPAGNGLPLGVGLDFGVSFTVQTTNPSHFLADGGNPGLAVDSGIGDPNVAELSPGEQLQFSEIQITNVSIRDPLGLLQPGATVSNPQWKALRSATFSGADAATTSSDAAGTLDVTTFLGNNPANPAAPRDIENNYTKGVFPPLSSVYVTTTAGNWPLKGIRYQVELNYELAPTPATRRIFQFGDPGDPPVYDGALTHQITDNNTTIMIAAIGGAGAALDTNNLGVGVNSDEDDLEDNTHERFINGALPTPEAIHFSFDRDVSFESLTLGNLELDGTEGVVLSFVSGTNPFTGLAGYSGDYTLGADSLTFNTTSGGQTPYAITYGKNGQDELMVEAGTVLALTSNPAFDSGFILDMITVNVPGSDADFDDDGDVDADDLNTWTTNFGMAATETTGDADGDGDADGADFLQWQRELNIVEEMAVAVPEPAAAVLLLIAGAVCCAARRCRFRSPPLDGEG